MSGPLKYLVVSLPESQHSAKQSRFVSAVHESTEPWNAKTENLDSKQASDIRKDPSKLLVLQLPIRLISPLAQSNLTQGDGDSWGVAAVTSLGAKESGRGAKVAIIDTGIALSHPAFPDTSQKNGLQLKLKDFTEEPEGKDGIATDTDGHGTHCAGTIFGRDVNGVRIGIAQGVEEALIAKVLAGGSGSGDIAAINNAILWAVENGANIISLSLGIDYPGAVEMLKAKYEEPEAVSMALRGYAEMVQFFSLLQRLVTSLRKVRNRPVPLFIAAAGNESRRRQDPNYRVHPTVPAVAEGFISVTAIDQSNAIAAFANTGAYFAAPGVNIRSASLDGTTALMSGTSMAAPHVSGVAALWYERLSRSQQHSAVINASDLLDKLRNSAFVSDTLDAADVGCGIAQGPKLDSES